MGHYVFAGDHGVTVEGISAYPSKVTAQMLQNFEQGGAAINVLARHFGVAVEVVDCGVGRPTRNFSRERALTPEQMDEHLAAGQGLAREAADKFTIVGVGEMGIGNTSAASAITAALLSLRAVDVTGAGSGLDGDGISHKVRVIERALELHGSDCRYGRKALEFFGGHEMARIAGFLIGAAELRLPVMLDGFITTAAALAATRMDPRVRSPLFFSHCSTERGHRLLLDALAAEPLLDLGMRLGEGTGAVMALGLLDAGWRLYSEMASFDSANISGPIG
jgi:nicotinate-nucleotide--dimethylbenzimidazole phosphoribosyltransferase